MIGRKSILSASLALWALAAPVPSVLATLGESGNSVASDRRALSAEHRRTAEGPGYTVREMQSGSVTIREYISRSDRVFGIGWNGIAPPDLDQLLGSYGEEYKQSLRAAGRKPGNRSSSRVATGRVVVETWGHMRNLQGRAYVPALIPEGVTVDEIR